MRLAAIVAAFLFATIAFAVDGVAGPFKVSLRTDPLVVPVGKAKVSVVVTDKNGKPVPDATVKVFARMPGMNMGEREETATATEPKGTYTAPATFSMAGQYDVTVSVSTPAGSGQAVLGLATGQSSAGDTGNAFPWAIGAVVVGLGALVLWRMKVTGQRASLKGLLNRTVLLSLAGLAAALAVGVWAVRNLRREGAMTPIEAQVMEMNTPAPEGELPVVLAEAKKEPFAESVSYAGQVVGFVEQDVVPRVSGTIVAMPVYVGDKVKRGQLLARLDTSQTDPMVAEKASNLRSAGEGVNIALDEHHHAIETAAQSAAQLATADADVAEAKSQVRVAELDRTRADAEVDSAKSMLKAARSEVEGAKSQQTLARQELERAQALFAKNALSREEMQAATAAARRADADVDSAHAKAEVAEGGLRAATAAAQAARAQVDAARARLTRAEAGRKEASARKKVNDVEIHAAEARLRQSKESVAAASAGLQGATVQRGYAELRAEVDGVVTQRLISPGVVVAPGQSVLRVAQVSPVRLQANVAQIDLDKVKVGDQVRVKDTRPGQEPITVTVTSVSPSVDPTSRTGIVEAVYANADNRFSPGQFVSMDIQVGQLGNALVVPTESVVIETRNGKTVAKVWVATASAGGRLSVIQREVRVGGRAGDKTAVLDGLQSGERVVVSPFGLADGMAVRSLEAPTKATEGTVTIELDASGYSPASVEIAAGRPAKLVFVRRAAESCGTSVKFPDLGIEAETPLNQPVTIDIPPQAAGKRLTFACPMDMYTGTVVVK
ncbi:MAG: efflux RND transporter periplasmic adaptor subunit [Fimbriimonadaceae bacterium]|nr:efflux RND transporter periplasmic adaptor subunit [Fimbriimonadaceae bacterium]